MNYRYVIIFLFFTACTNYNNNNFNKKSFSSKGFAYIYTESDYSNKLIKKKFNNDNLAIGHSKLKVGSLVKITNPISKKSITLKSSKKLDYPDFYQILITRAVAKKIDIDFRVPFVEIEELKKNKLFVAQKAETFNEEKKIHSKAPVQTVKIKNLSKKKKILSIRNKNFSITIAQFYSQEGAKTLRNRILKESAQLDAYKLKITNISKNKIKLTAGPYTSINLLKNDYIKLRSFGIEDLEINIYE